MGAGLATAATGLAWPESVSAIHHHTSNHQERTLRDHSEQWKMTEMTKISKKLKSRVKQASQLANVTQLQPGLKAACNDTDDIAEGGHERGKG